MKKLLIIIFLISMNETIISQDWANLNRYKDENLKLNPPSEKENRVVFMGNSITEGWLETYPEYFSGKPFINRGISGQTTPQMLLRFRADVINLEPKIVVILAGTNDIAENTGPTSLEMIENNIASMAELAKINNIKVILSSVLPALDYYWNPGLKPAEKIIELNNWIKNYSKQNNFNYVDYYSNMVDENKGLKKEYSEDGIHPNRNGYLVMSKLVEDAINNSLYNSSKIKQKIK